MCLNQTPVDPPYFGYCATHRGICLSDDHCHSSSIATTFPFSTFSDISFDCFMFSFTCYDALPNLKIVLHLCCTKYQIKLDCIHQIARSVLLSIISTQISYPTTTRNITVRKTFCIFKLKETNNRKLLHFAQNLACKMQYFTPLHITPALIQLHWLPVKQRALYKLAFITFNVLQHI